MNEIIKMYKLRSINFKRSFYLSFSMYDVSVPNYEHLVSDEAVVKPEKTIKYLGIIIDCDIKWDYQIKYIK